MIRLFQQGLDILGGGGHGQQQQQVVLDRLRRYANDDDDDDDDCAEQENRTMDSDHGGEKEDGLEAQMVRRWLLAMGYSSAGTAASSERRLHQLARRLVVRE